MRSHPPLRTSTERKRTIAATYRERRRRRRGDPNIATMNIKAEAGSDVKDKRVL
jgi:hypothetical protein